MPASTCFDRADPIFAAQVKAFSLSSGPGKREGFKFKPYSGRVQPIKPGTLSGSNLDALLYVVSRAHVCMSRFLTVTCLCRNILFRTVPFCAETIRLQNGQNRVKQCTVISTS